MGDLKPFIEPIKDESRAHPVPDVWRSTIREIVRAFVEGDYMLRRGVPGVLPIAADAADRIMRNISQYGEALAELPDCSWESSISQWMRTYWDVLVDLSTVESGRSDLVLFIRVTEERYGFEFKVDSVHVP